MITNAVILCIIVLLTSSGTEALFLEGLQDSFVDEVTPVTFHDKVIQQRDESTLVVFCTSWSEACRALAPTLAEAAEMLKASQEPASLYILDADAHREFARRFHINVYPTLLAFGKGNAKEIPRALVADRESSGGIAATHVFTAMQEIGRGDLRNFRPHSSITPPHDDIMMRAPHHDRLRDLNDPDEFHRRMRERHERMHRENHEARMKAEMEAHHRDMMDRHRRRIEEDARRHHDEHMERMRKMRDDAFGHGGAHPHRDMGINRHGGAGAPPGAGARYSRHPPSGATQAEPVDETL